MLQLMEDFTQVDRNRAVTLTSPAVRYKYCEIALYVKQIADLYTGESQSSNAAPPTIDEKKKKQSTMSMRKR
jgi:hypothetical protein